MKPQDRISQLIDRLIAAGNDLVKNARSDGHGNADLADTDAMLRWYSDLELLVSMSGKLLDPWRESLVLKGTNPDVFRAQKVLAALCTIRSALDNGDFIRFEDMVYAEAFTDLYQQGEYLLDQKYFLAAGVIFRAVLEERLRLLCTRNGCLPQKDKPTINDFNMALYTQSPPVYDTAMFENIKALAAVGNKAAHNIPGLTEAEVSRLQQGLQEFLQRFST